LFPTISKLNARPKQPPIVHPAQEGYDTVSIARGFHELSERREAGCQFEKTKQSFETLWFESMCIKDASFLADATF